MERISRWATRVGVKIQPASKFASILTTPVPGPNEEWYSDWANRWYNICQKEYWNHIWWKGFGLAVIFAGEEVISFPAYLEGLERGKIKSKKN